jgi:hypothetical protein
MVTLTVYLRVRCLAKDWRPQEGKSSRILLGPQRDYPATAVA